VVAKQYPTHNSWAAQQHVAPFSEVFADMKDRLVYLTADATTELTELLPDHAYIIGGIVDRNRYKNLCLDRAKELGIKSARLPIGDHLKLAGSKVLFCWSSLQPALTRACFVRTCFEMAHVPDQGRDAAGASSMCKCLAAAVINRHSAACADASDWQP
jgi:hypothetical protein